MFQSVDDFMDDTVNGLRGRLACHACVVKLCMSLLLGGEEAGMRRRRDKRRKEK